MALILTVAHCVFSLTRFVLYYVLCQIIAIIVSDFMFLMDPEIWEINHSYRQAAAWNG